jgi:hypothetical protein
MSRKASTFSDSYSLKQGISPGGWLWSVSGIVQEVGPELDHIPLMILQKIQDAREVMLTFCASEWLFGEGLVV